MAVESPAGEATPRVEGIDYQMKQTLISPLGVQIQKIDRPDGKKEVHLIVHEGLMAGPDAMVPTEARVYRFSEAQAREIATQLTGGISIARANEIPR